MKETAYQCKHTGGVPPLGYTLNPDKTYAVDPVEAEAVCIIFSMYADGRGYSEIIDALHDRKTKTESPLQRTRFHPFCETKSIPVRLCSTAPRPRSPASATRTLPSRTTR
jgi:site-specific DNA recombinase